MLLINKWSVGTMGVPYKGWARKDCGLTMARACAKHRPCYWSQTGKYLSSNINGTTYGYNTAKRFLPSFFSGYRRSICSHFWSHWYSLFWISGTLGFPLDCNLPLHGLTLVLLLLVFRLHKRKTLLGAKPKPHLNLPCKSCKLVIYSSVNRWFTAV